MCAASAAKQELGTKTSNKRSVKVVIAAKRAFKGIASGYFPKLESLIL